jgi:TusE/DsrC/DsvC family sulfur relay protein
MPVIEHDGMKVELDEDGFLVNFEAWNEKVACAIAQREGISNKCPLAEQQIEILKFIRAYYKKYEAMPVVRAVCTNVHQPKNCEYVQFPDPVMASKIAGLPKLATVTGYEIA